MQNSELPMGIAIGVPSADGNRCRAAVSVVTLPGDSPQLTTAVEAGTYCLLIFDVSAVGSRTNQLSVTVVLIHP